MPEHRMTHEGTDYQISVGERRTTITATPRGYEHPGIALRVSFPVEVWVWMMSSTSIAADYRAQIVDTVRLVDELRRELSWVTREGFRSDSTQSLIDRAVKWMDQS